MDLKKILRPAYHRALSLLHAGNKCTCNCCGNSYRSFRAFDDGFRGMCWQCGSYPRNRAMKLVLDDIISNTDKPLEMLHIAPEACLREWLRKNEKVEYTAGDKRAAGYYYPDYVQNLNILNLPFDDNSFDFVVCSHVLEHIIDDGQAMDELRRVLRPDGCAIIQVPLDYDSPLTVEEKPADHFTPQQRLEKFGQFDHVRIYGTDFFDRMQRHGLPVSRIKMSDADNTRYCLYPWEDIMLVK